MASFREIEQVGKVPVAPPPTEAPDHPTANYDESKVAPYRIPDPLTTLGGRPVTNSQVWNEVRRPELLALFEEHVFGRAPVGRPPGLAWETIQETRSKDRLERTVRLTF